MINPNNRFIQLRNPDPNTWLNNQSLNERLVEIDSNTELPNGVEFYNETVCARRSVPKSRIKPRNVSREIGSDNWQMELNPLINPIKPVLTLEM